VLTQASLSITWGGAGTVRECINLGVPMLVFPVWSDQFGNAARVSSRNLGIQGNILNVTPQKMIELVEKVLADKTILSSVKKMKRQCNTTEEIQELVNFVKCQTSLHI
jgi:UDP:flavonoid glycosyltransferase YjiC (YdhE family)